jgi:hypothetical protein
VNVAIQNCCCRQFEVCGRSGRLNVSLCWAANVMCQRSIEHIVWCCAVYRRVRNKFRLLTHSCSYVIHLYLITNFAQSFTTSEGKLDMSRDMVPSTYRTNGRAGLSILLIHIYVGKNHVFYTLWERQREIFPEVHRNTVEIHLSGRWLSGSARPCR